MFADTSIHDLKTILQGSIIRVAEEPLLVVSVIEGDGFLLQGYTVQDGAEITIALDNPVLNFEPVPLGFIPSIGEVDFFSYRVPTRQYRVGLNSENFSFSLVNGAGFPEVVRMNARDRASALRRSISTTKKNKQLCDCIKGQYPSINNAFQALEEGDKHVVAVSREFAVDKNFCLFFRTEMVGVVTEEGVPNFARGRSYLHQFWEKMNAGV